MLYRTLLLDKSKAALQALPAAAAAEGPKDLHDSIEKVYVFTEN